MPAIQTERRCTRPAHPIAWAKWIFSRACLISLYRIWLCYSARSGKSKCFSWIPGHTDWFRRSNLGFRPDFKPQAEASSAVRRDRPRWHRCSQLVGGAQKHRAFGTIAPAEQIDLGLAFSEPGRRADCAERYKAFFHRKAPLPKPARRNRLWSGPTLFKRANCHHSAAFLHVLR